MVIEIVGNGGQDTNFEKYRVTIQEDVGYCISQYMDSYYNGKCTLFLSGTGLHVTSCQRVRYNGESSSMSVSTTEYNGISYIPLTVYSIGCYTLHSFTGAEVVYNASSESGTYSVTARDKAIEYFSTPQSGSGTATVEIDIEGERLTFESQMLGNTITRFIDGDAEVDMEDE